MSPKKQEIYEILKGVKDPELNIDIVTLGLVRDVTLDEDGVELLMTLTTPFCPYADQLIEDTENAVQKLPDSGAVRVEITFDPPWEPTEEVKMLLQA